MRFDDLPAPTRPAQPPPAGNTGWEAWTPQRYELAESLRVYAEQTVFVDLLRGGLYRCTDRPGEPAERLLNLGVPLGAVAPLASSPGDWIAAAGPGIALVLRGRFLKWLARPEEHATVPMRMNDAVCDPAGRFWATSMARSGEGAVGSLYRADPDGGVQRMLCGLTVPNGPAFTACGSVMYLADSAAGTVLRYAVNPVTGALGPHERFARLAPTEGRPDGMTVDSENHLWVALWGAGEVRRYAPDGGVAARLHVPTPHVSSVAFGGGLMYVSTARHRLERPDLLAGAVLARPSPWSAPAAPAFGGHLP
ncbi:SMP-30/gluconolactonase/LRE family protein [Streptomyces sp. L2]|uniref:SMP-30/gluconolactonase/LRE family protein n=1 Tax=Streptomyces sp. L2 TaxID=2162665 RepID=UPI0010105FD3|nr:SMP-30/gluconolactonase/LRE family protein [Streptomyces sp. L2]